MNHSCDQTNVAKVLRYCEGGQGGQGDKPQNPGGDRFPKTGKWGVKKKVTPQNHAESTQLAELRRLAKEKLKKKFCKSTFRRPRFSQHTNAFALISK